MENFPITESFLSFQGEGVHMGRRAYFIRLFGCNVKCEWCDSKNAWAASEPAQKMSAVQIAESAKKSGAEIAVITGGEPCIHNLSPILRELSSRAISAHLETSGTLPIPERDGAKFAWVALSPKIFCRPLDQSLARADELKFIVSDISEFSEYEKLAARAANAKAFWLHPEWSRATDKKLLSDICDFICSRGGLWRAGWQIHKNYSAR